MMKRHTLILLIALGLAGSAIAQPVGDRGEERDGDRPPPPREQREKEREKDRDKDRDKDREGHGERNKSQNSKMIPVDQLKEALQTLRELHGGEASPMIERIEKTAKENPELAARRLSNYPRLRELMQLRKDKPEAFQIHVRQTGHMRTLFTLMRPFHEAKRNDDQAKMDELRPKIREQVEGLLQVRLEMKLQEIEQLREKLKRLEGDIDKMRNQADELVAEKMKDIEQGRGARHEKKGRPDTGDDKGDGKDSGRGDGEGRERKGKDKQSREEDKEKAAD